MSPKTELYCLFFLWPSGLCDPGELPGYLAAHSREGRPGKAPLIHPPNLPGKSWLLWRSLRATGVDSICHGVHKEVCPYPICCIYLHQAPVSGCLVFLCKNPPPSVFVSPFSWFWGPVVTLQDCLAAFFARDELKGKTN